MTTMSKARKAEQQEEIEDLRRLLKPADTVTTKLDHVSRSGMMRKITPLVLVNDEHYGISARYIGYAASKILGLRCDDQAVKMGGCGMDMGFELVYQLSSALFPDGFDCIGERCPSNDHSNGDRDYTPGHVRHQSGGYALRQRWL